MKEYLGEFCTGGRLDAPDACGIMGLNSFVFFGPVWRAHVPLTSRQRVFLERLLDVYHTQSDAAIHYTELARVLGVANSTAYQVLKSLQQKGYVTSEYRLANGRAGPGRSMVLFRPSWKALRTFRRLLGEDARRQEWEYVKLKVLERLAREGLPDDEALLTDLVDAISDSRDPLAYCGRVLAASLVSIRSQLWSRAQEFGLFRDIKQDDAQGLEALDLLPGIALGLSWASRRDSSWLARLAQHARRYQAYLHLLDEGARLRLLRFSREVMLRLRFPLESS